MNPEEFKPDLSLKEKERRWSLARRKMAQEGLAAIIVYANDGHKRDIACRYFTNMLIFASGEHMLLMPVAGDPILLMSAGEQIFFARKISWIPAQNIYDSANKGADLTRHLIALKLQNKRIGVDNPDMWPVRDYLALKALCPDVELVDVTRWLTEIRVQKSSEEIRLMEDAIRIGELAHRTFLANLKPGMTEEEVVAHVEKVARANGVERRLWLINSTPEIAWPWLPGKTRIRKSNPVSFSPEFARTEGYAFQAIRTYCWEEPKGEFKRMWELWGELRRMVPQEFRPGRRIAEVAAKIEGVIKDWGFDYFNMGHGLGVHFFEESAISPNPLYPDWTLMPNEVYVFHPMVRAKGAKGPLAWVGDMYWVGEDSTRWMTPFLPGLPEMIPG
jgi:Xaa-Pro dipeptidase